MYVYDLQTAYESTDELLYGVFMSHPSDAQTFHINTSSRKPLILQNWFYNREFEPEFTIGLTLRQIEVANNVEEEQNLAKEWLLYVRIKKATPSTQKMEIDQGNDQFPEDIEYKLIEVKTIEDSDKFICPESILIMKRRPHAEVQEIRKK